VFLSNIVVNGEVDDEGEDPDEDDHQVDELDPRYVDENLPEDVPEETLEPGDPWAEELWKEIVVQDNPLIQERFKPPRPAPYYNVAAIANVGARSIPVGIESASDFMGLLFSDEILGRYVAETNLISKQRQEALIVAIPSQVGRL
jgi:hypothetical protein